MSVEQKIREVMDGEVIQEWHHWCQWCGLRGKTIEIPRKKL